MGGWTIVREAARRSVTMLAVVGLLVAAAVPADAAVAFRGARPHAAVRARRRPPEPTAGVLVAAGDIACDPASNMFGDGQGTPTRCRAADTLALIRSIDPDAVLPLGDEQYDDGRLTKFRRSYDLSWGKVRERSRPVPGQPRVRRRTRPPDTSGTSGLSPGPPAVAGTATTSPAGTSSP